MFKAHIADANILKKVIDAIKDLIIDANFICTDEGIQMQAMDSAHVSFITLNLPAEGFTQYECESQFTLGLNVANLSKILKCGEAGDSILLTADPEGDTLSITLESADGTRKSDFELRRIDIETDSVEIPDVEYSCSITMPCSTLQRIIRDLATFGETCTVSVKVGEADFSAKGEISKMTTTIKEDKVSKKESEHTVITVSSDVKQMFAMRYLNIFAKANGLTQQVGLFMSEGVPLYITYDMGEVGSIGYYLAPKLDD